jgi:hypothetical protein
MVLLVPTQPLSSSSALIGLSPFLSTETIPYASTMPAAKSGLAPGHHQVTACVTAKRL